MEMDAEQILKKAEFINRQLEILEKRTTSFNSISDSLKPEQAEGLSEIKRECEKLILEYGSFLKDAFNIIASLDNPVYSNLLFLKYHEGRSFSEIAKILNYSYRQILRIHKNAVLDFRQKYESKYHVK